MLCCLLLLYLGGCAVFDVKTRKIPNRWLLFWLVIFSLFLLYETRGQPQDEERSAIVLIGRVEAMLSFWTAILFTAAVLFPLYLFRLFGAGDLKLVSLLNGVLGIYTGFTVIFYGLAISAGWSFFYMLRKRILLKRINYFLLYIMNVSTNRQIVPYNQAGKSDPEAAFCFAPFILFGFLIWLAVKGGSL